MNNQCYGKVCCSCRHYKVILTPNKRFVIGTVCDVDQHDVSYADSLSHKCMHWAKAKEGESE